jgi:hypothetical protein
MPSFRATRATLYVDAFTELNVAIEQVNGGTIEPSAASCFSGAITFSTGDAPFLGLAIANILADTIDVVGTAGNAAAAVGALDIGCNGGTVDLTFAELSDGLVFG